MRFSVITVCYNNRGGLEKTIKSVIGQTCKDYEFIVIDGGSNDGTKELLEQYDDQIDFWCSEPDKGIYNAMNKGVAHAHGDYVIFMNSGDIFHNKDVLFKINELNSKEDIIVGLVERMDNHNILFPHNPNIFKQLYTRTIGHQASFIKRSLLIEFPYDENYKTISDWKFWIDTIVYNNASYLRTDTIVAKQDMTGISCTSNVAREERLLLKEKYFPPLVRKEIDNSLFPPQILQNYMYLEKETKFLAIIYRKILSLMVKIIKNINH